MRDMLASLPQLREAKEKVRANVFRVSEGKADDGCCSFLFISRWLRSAWVCSSRRSYRCARRLSRFVILDLGFRSWSPKLRLCSVLCDGSYTGREDAQDVGRGDGPASRRPISQVRCCFAKIKDDD